jgi:hypothetical protein
MERLLSGSPSRKNEVILSSDASLIPEGDAWTAAVDPDLAGSQWRRYLVRLDILVAEGTIYQVQNRQDLFVVEDGHSWELLFHRDLGIELSKASTTITTLSRLKSSYADVDPLSAESPDRLVELFMHTLNTRDLQLYDSLLHEGYEFQFPVDEFDLAETADGRWARQRGIASMGRLMEGSPSRDDVIVQGVDLSMSASSAPWSDIVEPEFTGTQRRIYTVRMDVSVSGGTIYQVRGENELYVVQVGDIWQLRFHRDNGVELTKRGTASKFYGAVKSLY